MALEVARNRERYAFLKWAGQALDQVRLFPPGTGILHTINLEHLAEVISSVDIDGDRWAVPDTLIGTDSHTPMIGALGVLGWGVGGLEAQGAMFGLPSPLLLPEVVGVRMTGALSADATATDIALVVTETLRRHGVVGSFIEYFGDGVAAIPVGARAAIANMAPEYGATVGFFPIDSQTLRYLRETGRAPCQIALVEACAKRQGFWAEGAEVPRYDRVIDIDLSRIGRSIAGPHRPQDRRASSALASTQPGVPDAAIAIAAITSCTNSADPRLLVAAGLLARRARARGLRVPAWVKTSFAPGSGVALRYLRRAGLLDDLAALGFDVVGIGCTTCIGQSGALMPAMAQAMAAGTMTPRAVLSGNRNFPRRVHPEIDAAFLASPPLVVAWAIAGRASISIEQEPIATDAQGRPVLLKELWPGAREVDEAIAACLDPSDVTAHYAVRAGNEEWQSIEATAAPLHAWNPASTYLRAPPFVGLVSTAPAAIPNEGSADDSSKHSSALALLAVYGDDVTTDHISPAGAIAPDSAAGHWLIAAGCDPADLNVFASRRGNFEVMARGGFTHPDLVNRLCLQAGGGMTVDALSGTVLPIRDAALGYQRASLGAALIAGERYGAGSSRDWAAKVPALLGVNVVLAASFERIHRANLIGMGIAPIELPPAWHPDRFDFVASDRIRVGLDGDARPDAPVDLTLVRADGSQMVARARLCCETAQEVEVLLAGGLIPLMLQRTAGEPIRHPIPLPVERTS